MLRRGLYELYTFDTLFSLRGRRSYLLEDLKSVIHLDANALHRRLWLGVPEKQLHGSEILSAPVYRGRLGPSHRVRPVQP